MSAPGRTDQNTIDRGSLSHTSHVAHAARLAEAQALKAQLTQAAQADLSRQETIIRSEEARARSLEAELAIVQSPIELRDYIRLGPHGRAATERCRASLAKRAQLQQQQNRQDPQQFAIAAARKRNQQVPRDPVEAWEQAARQLMTEEEGSSGGNESFRTAGSCSTRTEANRKKKERRKAAGAISETEKPNSSSSRGAANASGVALVSPTSSKPAAAAALATAAVSLCATHIVSPAASAEKRVVHPGSGTRVLPFREQQPTWQICPLTGACMVDPVVAADGNSYERVAIQSWLLDRGAVSPTTGATLPHTGLTPNHALRSFLAHPARSR